MLPTVEFCGLQVTRLIIGANPFGGYSHQNPERDREMVAYYTPERIAEIKRHDLRVNFSQGLNIRNITEDQAKALSGVRFRNPTGKTKQVMFAWDDPRHEKLIHKGIDRCVNAGIPAWAMGFYVLIGYHSTPEQDLHRVNVLKDYGCDPYAMPYNKDDPYQRRFTRWVNHRAIFNSVPWAEYQ